MDVSKLEKEELMYELKTRGITAIDDINEMRHVLKGLLKIEIEGKQMMVTNSNAEIDVKNEIRVCVKKLQFINGMIDKIEGDRFCEQFRVVDAKLCHLMNRVDNLVPKDDQDKKERSNLLKGILFLMRKMETMASSSSVMEKKQNDVTGNVLNHTVLEMHI